MLFLVIVHTYIAELVWMQPSALDRDVPNVLEAALAKLQNRKFFKLLYVYNYLYINISALI